ncbi:MAG: hypothetical protein M5U34_38145 [Chloroflexi bacterium]|nr:hypothetical protein [Chloroflexota bacterium]
MGTVRGFVYLDVNGDGRCVNTGVAGEEAVVGIPVEFVSSDEKHTITNTSAINGAYELAGAGLSYWRVTAKPDNNWVVTSQNPLYAPVTEENLAAVDVNFCVAKAGTAVYPLIAPVYTVPTTGDYLARIRRGGPDSRQCHLMAGAVGPGLYCRWRRLARDDYFI